MTKAEPTQEQLDKLPKWAQDYIGDILRERYGAQKAMEDAQSMFLQGVTKQTWTANGTMTELDMPDSTVRFYFDRERHSYIDVSFRRIPAGDESFEALDVRTAHGLKIHPMAYNSIYVQCED